MNGYPSFYPRIALVAPSPGWYHQAVLCTACVGWCLPHRTTHSGMGSHKLISCYFCTYWFIAYPPPPTCYGKFCIIPPMANMGIPDFLIPGGECRQDCCGSAMLTEEGFVKWTESKLARSFSGLMSVKLATCSCYVDIKLMLNWKHTLLI